MSFWRAETLEKKLPGLIEPYDPNAIDCAAYTLHVGNEVYISPDQEVENADRHTMRKLADGECFAIPPGQFAFLLTKEDVAVPDDAIAFLSIKARIKFRGLINISGFHVDPAYRGRLLFSVLNAGPQPLHVQQGDALFLIWYASLDGRTENNKRGQGFGGIDSALINGISGPILSLQSLSEKQHMLEKEMVELRTKFSVSYPRWLVLLGIAVTWVLGMITPWLLSLLQNAFGINAR